MELYNAASMAETMGRVLEDARRATGCDCAGVVLVQRGRRLRTAGVTDRRVEQADRLQLEYGEGPCVPVSREHHSVLVADTMVDRRWPRWCPRVAEMGLRSVLTVWLLTTRSTLGALNLYRTRPGQFTADDEVTARLLDTAPVRGPIETSRLRGSEATFWGRPSGAHKPHLGSAVGLEETAFRSEP